VEPGGGGERNDPLSAWFLTGVGSGDNPNPEGAMRAKRFFYVCAGLLLLVVAYSIGAHRADAQSGSSTIVAVTNGYPITNSVFAVAANGAVYISANGGNSPWTYSGNIFGGTIQVESKSLSDVKGAYRGK
jgi:hypothetical protein